MQREDALCELQGQSSQAEIFARFATRGFSKRQPPQWAAWVICSREEITFPSCTSSKIVRIWRVVTGAAVEKGGTVITGKEEERASAQVDLLLPAAASETP